MVLVAKPVRAPRRGTGLGFGEGDAVRTFKKLTIRRRPQIAKRPKKHRGRGVI